MIYTDSKTLHDSINSTKQIEDLLERTSINWIKQRLLQGSEANLTAVKHIEGKKMLADCLTKKAANPGRLLKTIREAKFPN